MKKLLFLAALFCVSYVYAQPPIPDPAGRWVIDDAGVLSIATESTISSLCQHEFDSTSNQIVVYLFNSLEGGTIETYSNDVFNKWGIGSKKNNNGVLLAVAINDRKMRIEVGYGLEPFLTDLEASAIIENDIKPWFKQGDYDKGVTSGVEKIIYAITNSYHEAGTYNNVSPNGPMYDENGHFSMQNKVFRRTYIIGFIIWMVICFGLSRLTLSNGIFIFIFVAFFMVGFYVFSYGWLWGGLMLISGLALQLLLNYIWKPKTTGKFWSAVNGGAILSSGSSSSYSSWSSGSDYSSGSSDYGGFSGGGGSSGGGGASGSW